MKPELIAFDRLLKITDEKFVRYFEKEVKGGQVLKLKRIKVKQ